jgi:aminoglycoside 6'-N-acetyltransferase I
MSVRPLRTGDTAEWLRMRRALWPRVSPIEQEAAALSVLTRSGVVLVSEAETGGLNGFLELSIRSYAEGCGPGPVPFIEGWYVDPDHRGRRTGASLVHAAEEWARAHGYLELASDTELDNDAGYRAHVALGFVEVARSIHFRKALT